MSWTILLNTSFSFSRLRWYCSPWGSRPFSGWVWQLWTDMPVFLFEPCLSFKYGPFNLLYIYFFHICIYYISVYIYTCIYPNERSNHISWRYFCNIKNIIVFNYYLKSTFFLHVSSYMFHWTISTGSFLMLQIMIINTFDGK